MFQQSIEKQEGRQSSYSFEGSRSEGSQAPSRFIRRICSEAEIILGAAIDVGKLRKPTQKI